MKTAAISELKARLSEFLTQVKAGNEVLITDRGKAVARLVPVVKSDVDSRNDSMVLMEKQGLIKLGSSRLPKNFWKMERGEDRKSLVREAILEERGEGR
ncbi:MAG: type II toxin-antitoxin system prevent-host-death family antitoxin [Desulfobacteraceae bacterium]|nr:MAG: type II toxin-antitoxin system prevent-host-death family antitoxin [Desulfobacteraceae bacterium]